MRKLATDEIEIRISATDQARLPDSVKKMFDYYPTADWYEDDGTRVVWISESRWPEINQAMKALTA